MEKYEKLEIEVIEFSEDGIWTDDIIIKSNPLDGAEFTINS